MKKKSNPFAWNEAIQKLTAEREPAMVIGGCECCLGDEPLSWTDEQNNAFVDSTGDILVTVKDHTMRFKVRCCPNCGRIFCQ